MTARKKNVELIGEINPHGIYRTSLGAAIFGYAPQRIKDLIKSGELPPSFPLTEHSRFEAWFGQQIIDHWAKMRALAAKKTAAAEKRPQPPQLAAAKQKTKKLKLRPPGGVKETAHA